MLLIIATFGALSLAIGKRTDLNGGIGSDGLVYAAVVESSSPLSLDNYSFHRIVPSLIVKLILLLTRQPIDRVHIVAGFAILNYGMLLLSCVLYRSIMRDLSCGISGVWLGFFALFCNFTVLTTSLYDPVLTDATAVALSLAMLLLCLRKQHLCLFLVSLLGAFTWPTLLYIGIFLLAYPRAPIPEQKARTPRLLAGAFAASTLVVAVVAYSILQHHGSFASQARVFAMMPLSLLLTLAYAYASSAQLLRGISIRAFHKSLSLIGVAMALSLAALSILPLHLWVNRNPKSITTAGTVEDIVARSLAEPLVFLASHPIYFGPAFLLLLFYWKSFSSILRRYGIGLVLAIWLGIFTSFTPESRQSIPAYAMAAPFLGVLSEETGFADQLLWPGAILSVIVSRFWIIFSGSHNTITASHGPSFCTFSFPQFSAEAYCTFLNSWISPRVYLEKAAIVLALAGIGYACTKRPPLRRTA